VHLNQGPQEGIIRGVPVEGPHEVEDRLAVGPHEAEDCEVEGPHEVEDCAGESWDADNRF
jgi:hypothetical protein